MAKVLYIDACGGASGDMLAGALLDLGWPLKHLEDLIARLGLGPVMVEHVKVKHKGIQAARLGVNIDGRPGDSLADHNHSPGCSGHNHNHHHDHNERSSESQHYHDHKAEDGHHHAPHRGLREIRELLKRLPDEISGPAEKVFTRLAEAEAKVHGASPEEVHFHEVGAVDAIVDVLAVCAGLAWLKPDQIICSPLPLGQGQVRCAHGLIPLPAPAVLNLLANVPVYSWPEKEETVTPTGAALLTALCHEFAEMPAMILLSQGWGGGSRPSQGKANVLRMILGESRQPSPDLAQDEVVELSTNLDDQSPEDMPFVFRQLLAAGALDVAAAPLIMKHGRPGVMLKALARPEQAEDLAALILNLTTSIGLRMAKLSRRLLPREEVTMPSPWGPIQVKRSRQGQYQSVKPEAVEIERLAASTGLSPDIIRQELFRFWGKE